MKRLIFAGVGLIILLSACKKDEGHQYTPLEKQQVWKKEDRNPVFIKGNKALDDGIILGHSVIKTTSTYKMWYSGGHGIESLNGIGYATSTDGINWTRYSGDPVFLGKPGSWDESNVAIPVILQDGAVLRMWYLSGDPNGDKIGYATSVDGINWNRYPSPVFQSKAMGWYRDGIFPGTVIKENGIFKMWFSGSIGSLRQSTLTTENSIGYATSPDGIHWAVYDNPATTNAPYHFSDPVVKHGIPGEWDVTSALAPSVIKTEAGYEMWYAGENFSTGEQHLGYAFSKDGIAWTKYDKNPVLLADTWNIQLVFPSVILDVKKYRMWYGAFLIDGTTVGGAIGYATMASYD